MEINVKFTTPYIHEMGAEIQKRVLEGYVLDTRPTFCLKRIGSAYVAHFIPTREVVDFDDYFPWTEEEEQAITKLYQEMAEKRASKVCKDFKFVDLGDDENCNHIDRKAVEELNQLTIQQKWEIDDELDAEFEKLLEQSKPLPKELLDRMQDLRDKAEANREREEALNELAEQSQQLGMYEKDNGIFDRLVESIESAQNNPEGCVSTIFEVDKERVKVYSKSELENMEWSEFKKLIDDAGIRGRRRQNLTRDYLIYQEENLK